MILGALMLVGLASSTQLPADADSLRAAATTALTAVEGDTVARVRQRLESLVRTHRDPAAGLGLAYLALLSYDYAEADRRFESIRTSAPPGSALQAFGQLGLAQSALSRGQVARADTLLTAAIARARSTRAPLIEAEALLLETLVAARLRGPDAASDLLSRVDSLLPQGEKKLRARATCIRAQLTSSRDLVAALHIALEGAVLARAAGSLRYEGYCLFVAAGAVSNQGNTDSSLVLFSQAALVQRRARDRSGLAATLQWRGYALMDAGFYGESRIALTQAITDGLAAGNLSPVAWAHLSKAELALYTGELEDIEPHTAAAESLFAVTGDVYGPFSANSVKFQRARAVGDTIRARQAAERLAAGASRYGWHWPVFGQRMLAFVAVDAGDFATARRHLDSARVFARALGAAGLESSVEQDRGLVALREGKNREARAIFARVAAGTPAAQASSRHYTLTQLALADLRLGEVDRAATTAAAAAAELDQWRAGLDDRQLRQSAYDLRRYEDPSFAVADIVTGLAAAGRTELAFDLAERRRARHLLDRIALAEGLARATVTSNRSAAAVLGPSDVARAIPDDSTVILEFVRGGTRAPITVFLLSRTGLRAVKLPPVSDLGPRVRRFVTLLEAGAGADSLAQSLGADLLAPVIPAIPAAATRLVIVPDLELHGVPFEALRVGGSILLQRFTVSYAPSASVIARLWQRKRPAGPATMLALADPSFADEVEPGSAAEVFRDAFDRTGGLPRLRASAREARAVARYAERADIRLRENASEAGLKRAALGEYRVVHLATHALVDDRSPARSALALTAGDGEDGFVSPSELAALGLTADLLVLSGCRTARGLVAGGEGVQGLAAPAIEAGARSVLASGWLVGDISTAKVMERFYRHLASGQPIGAALRATKLDLVREGVSAGVWASFTLLGDPHTVLPMRVPARRVPWAAVVAGLVAIAATAYGVVIVRRRGRDETSIPSGSNATTTQR